MKTTLNSSISEQTKEIKEDLKETSEGLKEINRKLERAIELTRGQKKDRKRRARKMEKKKITMEAVAEEPKNEGDIVVEELFSKLEMFRNTEEKSLEGWEKAREHYNKAQEILTQNESAMRDVEREVDDFEKKVVEMAGGSITYEDLQKFRERSNLLSVWFGRYCNVLQIAAASGVVFYDVVKRHGKDVLN